jgi:hypothetical protein
VYTFAGADSDDDIYGKERVQQASLPQHKEEYDNGEAEQPPPMHPKHNPGTKLRTGATSMEERGRVTHRPQSAASALLINHTNNRKRSSLGAVAGRSAAEATGAQMSSGVLVDNIRRLSSTDFPSTDFDEDDSPYKRMFHHLDASVPSRQSSAESRRSLAGALPRRLVSDV